MKLTAYIVCLIMSMASTPCFAIALTVINPDFEEPEISYNLVIQDTGSWAQVSGWTGGPYTFPLGQRGGESGIHRNAGNPGNTAFGNSNCGNIYQLLGDTFTPGSTYTLSATVKNDWYAETITAEFYYLVDELDPTARTVLASQIFTLDDGSNTDHNWKQIQLGFYAEPAQTYLGKQVGIQFSGLGAGDGGDPGRAWWYVDQVNVDRQSISNIYPPDNAIDIYPDVIMSWTAPLGFIPEGYDVYFTPAVDPNFIKVSSLQQTTDYDPVPDLEYDATYYWRIDTYEPNDVNGMSGGGYIVNPGSVLTFSTISETPVITQQSSSLAVFAGDYAEFTLSAQSPTPITYHWYKTLDNANDTPADDLLVQSNDANSLTFSAVQATDHGYYYCHVDNSSAFTVMSNTAQLFVKDQIAHLQFETDFDDSLGNYDMIPAGDPIFVTGPNTLGQAVSFDGVDDYLTSDFTAEDFIAGFTVSLWAKAASLGQPQYSAIFHAAPAFQIDLDGNGSKYRFNDGATATTFGDVSTDNWILLTVSCDANACDMYYNGIKTASHDATDLVLSRFALGLSQTLNLDHTFEGAVDDLKIFNYPLDKYQIYDEYYAVVPVDACFEELQSDVDVTGPDGVPDCLVDMYDFAAFAQQWLTCTLYPTCQ